MSDPGGCSRRSLSWSAGCPARSAFAIVLVLLFPPLPDPAVDANERARNAELNQLPRLAATNCAPS